MAGVRSDIKFVKGAWKVHLGHPTWRDDIGSNIQVIFRPNAMFGGERSKHNDEIKVKVSKLWKLFTATKTRNTRLRRSNFPFRERSLPFLRHLENFWTIIESFSTKKKDIHNPDSNPVLSYANLSPLPLHYHANPPQFRKIKVYIIINCLS